MDRGRREGERERAPSSLLFREVRKLQIEQQNFSRISLFRGNDAAARSMNAVFIIRRK